MAAAILAACGEQIDEMILTRTDILRLCRIGENSEVEFKSAKGGFPKEFWKSFSAFANSEGGKIVLGVIQKQDSFYPDGLLNILAREVLPKAEIMERLNLVDRKSFDNAICNLHWRLD